MENIHRVQSIVQEISKKFNEIFTNTATLIWFGSWVKGDAYKQSDIDLAIKSNKKLSNNKVLKFKEYLSDFPTLYKIDLVDMNYTNKLLSEEITKYGKKL